MSKARAIRIKCLFAAWISGWAIAIFLPSLLIALTGESPLAEGRTLLRGALAVADEMAPAAKLGFGFLYGALMLVARRIDQYRGAAATLRDMALAAIAMLAMLAVIPEPWSRGFGIGLAGERFAPVATGLYLLGAVLGGLVFALSERKCSARSGNSD